MSFDPTNFNPVENYGNVENFNPNPSDMANLEPGNYILWCAGFNRNQRHDKTTLSLMCKPLLNSEGVRVDQSRYYPVWINGALTAKGIFKIQNFCAAIGVTKPFNINSDQECSGVMKFKPFKAYIKHETYKGKTKAVVGRFLPQSSITDVDRKKLDEISNDETYNQATKSSSDSSGFEEPTPGGYSGRNHVDNDGSSSDFTDEDIPF